MSRLATTFVRLNEQGRKALIPYVTAGYPDADITPALMHVLVEAGADVIELGVPFSDPSADGPTIQAANEHALRHGREDAGTADLLVQQARDAQRVVAHHLGLHAETRPAGEVAIARVTLQ